MTCRQANGARTDRGDGNHDARDLTRRVELRVQLHAVPCGLGPVAARRHVAPPPAAVLRLVLKDAAAAWIGAAAHAFELREDECVGGALDDRNEQSRER